MGRYSPNKAGSSSHDSTVWRRLATAFFLEERIVYSRKQTSDGVHRVELTGADVNERDQAEAEQPGRFRKASD